MRCRNEESKSPNLDLGPIGLLVMSFFTNVGITLPSGSNRSLRLVMYVLGSG